MKEKTHLDEKDIQNYLNTMKNKKQKTVVVSVVIFNFFLLITLVLGYYLVWRAGGWGLLVGVFLIHHYINLSRNARPRK